MKMINESFVQLFYHFPTRCVLCDSMSLMCIDVTLVVFVVSNTKQNGNAHDDVMEARSAMKTLKKCFNSLNWLAN